MDCNKRTKKNTTQFVLTSSQTQISLSADSSYEHRLQGHPSHTFHWNNGSVLRLISSLPAHIILQWLRLRAMSSELPAPQPVFPLESYIVAPANNRNVSLHHAVTPQIQEYESML